MLRFLKRPFLLLAQHRHLLWQTTMHDIKARFVGSSLGLAWLALYPLIFLSVYAMVYALILKVRFQMLGTAEYVVLIFCGLIPFLGFSEAVSTGVTSVVSNATLIKNTLFPIELIPVKSVLASQCTQAVGTVLLLIAVSLVRSLTPAVVFLPMVWINQLLFMMGLVWILASVCVYVRDLQYLVSTGILLLMVFSPIAYSVDMIPPHLRVFMSVNPLYYFIVSYQDCLMYGRIPRPECLTGVCVLGLGFFTAGFWFFEKMKKVFADNV